MNVVNDKIPNMAALTDMFEYSVLSRGAGSGLEWTAEERSFVDPWIEPGARAKKPGPNAEA